MCTVPSHAFSGPGGRERRRGSDFRRAGARDARGGSIDGRRMDTLERPSPDHERKSLVSSGASTSSQLSVSRRRAGVERCFYWTTVVCGIAFLFLGICILPLGIVASNWYTGSYIAGGATESVLGVCLIVRLMLKCTKCPGVSTSLRNAGDTTSCVLFVALTLLFLVWCATVCSFCTALVLSAMNYGGDRTEVAAIVLSCVSLVLEFVFGGSVCCWAGCPMD